MFQRCVFDWCSGKLNVVIFNLVMQDLASNDGSGGIIAVDAAGNIAMPFNSQGMYRGMVRKGSAPETSIY